MLSFFTLENRKRNTKKLCNAIHDKIKNIPHIFHIFSAIHSLGAMLMAVFLIFSDVHGIYFKIGIILFVTQILTNIYFNGCFLTKIERKIIGKHWYGIPYNLFFRNFKIQATTLRVNLLFTATCFLLMSIASYRIYMSP